MERTSGKKEDKDTGEAEFLKRCRGKTRRKEEDMFRIRNICRCQEKKLMAFLLAAFSLSLEPEGKIVCWDWSKMGDLRVAVNFWNARMESSTQTGFLKKGSKKIYQLM